MVKVIVTSEFTLGRFAELKNIERADTNKKEEGHLYVGDKFECTQEMADYLTGENKVHRSFVKIIEIIPEAKPKAVKEEKEEIKKPTKKKVAKKS